MTAPHSQLGRPDHRSGDSGTARWVSITGFLLVLVAAPAPYSGSDQLSTVLAVLVALPALIVTEQRRVVAWRALPFVLASFAVMSALWATLWMDALQGGLLLLTLAAAAWNFTRTLGVTASLTVLSRALSLLMFASILVAVVLPGVGLVSDAYESGALKGVFVHRNSLAGVAVVSTIAVLVRIGAGRERRGIPLGELLVALVCLVGARSQSALVVVGAVGVLWVVLRFARRLNPVPRYSLSIAISVSTFVLVSWGLSSLSQVTQWLGRDITLTGRTDIWEAVLAEVRNSPLVGTGWHSAFHRGLPASYRIWAAIDFEIYHSHNGYIDMLLYLGWVGLSLLIATIVLGLWLSLRHAVAGRGAYFLWPVSVMLALVVGNLTESGFTTTFGVLVLFLVTFQVIDAVYGETAPAGRIPSGGRVGSRS